MNGPQLEDNQTREAKPEYARTQQDKPQDAQSEEANIEDTQPEVVQLDDEYEIVSGSPVSDTLIEILQECEARRREAAAQTPSAAETTAVPATPPRKSQRKAQSKPRGGVGSRARQMSAGRARRKTAPSSGGETSGESARGSGSQTRLKSARRSGSKSRGQSNNAIVRVPKAAVPAIAAQPAPESALERHQRKCVICAHPEREDIEELFLDWHSPEQTAYHYRIPVRSIFRHAHATGLYSYRQGNLRAVLDRILEQAEDTKITGESVIRAVRAYTCLTDDNNWIEPASRVIFSSASAAASALALGEGGNLIDAPAIGK